MVDSEQKRVDDSPQIPELRHDLRILRALRRIVRFTELHSRYLASNFAVTGPQLVCLLAVKTRGSATASEIAREIFVSPSTVVGIIDRLEEKQLLERKRSESDRRVVDIFLTDKGRTLLKDAPSPLQDRLYEALSQLPELEQATLAQSLEQVVQLMDAEDVAEDALVEAGPLTQSAESKAMVSEIEADD